MKRLALLPVAALLLTACGHNSGTASSEVTPTPSECSSDIRESYFTLRSRFEAVQSRSDAFRCQEEMNSFLANNQGLNCSLDMANGHEHRAHMTGVLNEERLHRLMGRLETSYQLSAAGQPAGGPAPTASHDHGPNAPGGRHDFHRE